MKRKDVFKLIFCSVMAFNLTANAVVRAEDVRVEESNSTAVNETGTQPVENTATDGANAEVTGTNANANEATNDENAENVEDPNKYYIEFTYEDMDNLPNEVKETLPKMQELDSMKYLLSIFAGPEKPKKTMVEVKDGFWEFVKYTPETISDKKTLYKGSWKFLKKIEVSFVTDSPEGLPEDLKTKTYDNINVAVGKDVDVPENEELIKDGTVWILTWPKIIAGNENLTVTGNWTSRPLTYEGTVTFVTRNGNQTVKFTNPDEAINHTDADGNKANEKDSGGGFSKAYFMGWSNVENYDGTQEGGKFFYGHEAISRAFPTGFKGEDKLYAVYLTPTFAMSLANSLGGEIKINKAVSPEETMYKKFETYKEDEVSNDKRDENIYYLDNDLKEANLVNLGASFSLNPYVTAVVRNHSGIWDFANIDLGPADDKFILNPLNMNNLKEKIKDLETKYTFVDLHVKLDDRIKVAEQLNFDFKSYAFRPIVVLNKDYSAILESEINVKEGNPKSTITLTTNGEKEFIIRTRIRPKASIPNATGEEAVKDMQLISNSDENFSVSKANLLSIAREEDGPIEINGHIQGGANLRTLSMYGFTLGGLTDIPKQTANVKVLDFKPAHVVFNLNAPFKADREQELGWSRVALNGSIDDDVFNLADKPEYNAVPANNKIGEAMPDNPAIEKYKFEGYNTKEDWSGDEFNGKTVVRKTMLTDGEMTVYAQWSTAVSFDKNSTELKDSANQDLGFVDVKYNKNLENGILRDGKIPTPTLEGYEFKGWNTKKDGTGEKLDASKAVTEPVKYFAIWEKKLIISHEFISGTEGKVLPKEVLDKLPKNFEESKGNKVSPKPDNFDSVKVSDGTWTFKGWNEKEYTVAENHKFIGTWVFEKSTTPIVPIIPIDPVVPTPIDPTPIIPTPIIPTPQPQPEPNKPIVKEVVEEEVKPNKPNKTNNETRPSGKVLPKTNIASTSIATAIMSLAGVVLFKRKRK